MTIHASLCVLRRSARPCVAGRRARPQLEGVASWQAAGAGDITIVNPPVSPLQNTN